jgi:membrane-bound serine protease (ClpP class)
VTAQIEWLIGLAILGFALIAIEMFVPGMVLGILGGICLMIAVGIAFSAFGTSGGVVAIFVLIAASVVLTPVWIKYGPRTRIGRKLTLDTSDKDFQSAPVDFHRYTGQTGTTQSILRPSGIAIIGGDRVDVVSESGHIAAGKNIRVTRVEGMRIVVEEVSTS